MSNPKTIKIKVYADPGHAWAAVKRKSLEKLQIIDKISGYSYQRGATVYLEEDCDLSVFVNALKGLGFAVEYIESHTNNRSPIRSYDSFKIS